MPHGQTDGRSNYGCDDAEGGGKDAFVHISAVERLGFGGLNEGAKVYYDLESGRDGKELATNLKMVK